MSDWTASLKPDLLGGDQIDPDRQQRHGVAADIAGRRLTRETGLLAGDDHLDAWHHGAGESVTVPVIWPVAVCACALACEPETGEHGDERHEFSHRGVSAFVHSHSPVAAGPRPREPGVGSKTRGVLASHCGARKRVPQNCARSAWRNARSAAEVELTCGLTTLKAVHDERSRRRPIGPRRESCFAERNAALGARRAKAQRGERSRWKTSVSDAAIGE